MVADQSAARSIRVAVRVRPQLPSDGITGTELLQLDRSNGIVLSSGSDRRGGRRYAFDSVFGPDVTQVGRRGGRECAGAVYGAVYGASVHSPQT